MFQLNIWRVDIQKGVTHISEILHGGTETFPFRHLEIQIFDFQIENKNISHEMQVLPVTWHSYFWLPNGFHFGSKRPEIKYFL